MDAFTWSLPFVASKILEMLLGVLAVCTEEELEASDENLPAQVESNIVPAQEVSARRQEIKNKIMAVGKMQRLYAILRYVYSLDILSTVFIVTLFCSEEAEGATELLPDTRLPPPPGATGSWPGGFTPPSPNDALGSHVVDLRRQIRSFDDARHADIVNERLPQFTPSGMGLPAPSMWVPRLAAANEGEVDSANMSMESYIRRVLEEEVDGDTAERIAEKISRGTTGSLRPRGLKRFETT